MASARSQLPSAELAGVALAEARRAGAQSAAATASVSREVTVDWRDGKIERTSEATERSLSLELFVDGRYTSVTTSDLRPDAIREFVKDAAALARALVPDEDRALPDPGLYAGRTTADLELDDPAQALVSPDERKRFAQAIEVAARSVPGSQAILSVSTSFSDGRVELERVASDGFRGARAMTHFTAGGSVSVADRDGRPEDSADDRRRRRGDLASAEALGREAARRALSRIGASKGKSEKLVAVVENRAAGNLVRRFLGALGGEALQQKRSFLEGKLGQPVGSLLFTVTDDPLIRRGMGSRSFDGEGLAARPRPVVEHGVLASYFLDTYYARKLRVAPTSGAASNLSWAHGDKDCAALVAEVTDGILIEGFLGGNANPATGDFSLGVRGHRIRKGQVAEPLAEMNIAGNQLDLWKRLVAVGNDPYVITPLRTPTLVFDEVHFAGV